MAELTYAELTQGRESTRLPHTHEFTSLKNEVISSLHIPHTHKFTSLKNVVISALHKIDKRIHIQA